MKTKYYSTIFIFLLTFSFVNFISVDTVSGIIGNESEPKDAVIGTNTGSFDSSQNLFWFNLTAQKRHFYKFTLVSDAGSEYFIRINDVNKEVYERTITNDFDGEKTVLIEWAFSEITYIVIGRYIGAPALSFELTIEYLGEIDKFEYSSILDATQKFTYNSTIFIDGKPDTTDSTNGQFGHGYKSSIEVLQDSPTISTNEDIAQYFDIYFESGDPISYPEDAHFFMTAQRAILQSGDIIKRIDLVPYMFNFKNPAISHTLDGYIWTQEQGSTLWEYKFNSSYGNLEYFYRKSISGRSPNFTTNEVYVNLTSAYIPYLNVLEELNFSKELEVGNYYKYSWSSYNNSVPMEPDNGVFPADGAIVEVTVVNDDRSYNMSDNLLEYFAIDAPTNVLPSYTDPTWYIAPLSISFDNGTEGDIALWLEYRSLYGMMQFTFKDNYINRTVSGQSINMTVIHNMVDGVMEKGEIHWIDGLANKYDVSLKLIETGNVEVPTDYSPTGTLKPGETPLAIYPILITIILIPLLRKK